MPHGLWELFLVGFAYLDVGLTILVTYFILPLALTGIGIYWIVRRLRKCP